MFSDMKILFQVIYSVVWFKLLKIHLNLKLLSKARTFKCWKQISHRYCRYPHFRSFLIMEMAPKIQFFLSKFVFNTKIVYRHPHVTSFYRYTPPYIRLDSSLSLKGTKLYHCVRLQFRYYGKIIFMPFIFWDLLG